MHLAESPCCTRINESAVDDDTVSGRRKGRAHREVYRTFSTILKVIDSPRHAACKASAIVNGTPTAQ